MKRGVGFEGWDGVWVVGCRSQVSSSLRVSRLVWKDPPPLLQSEGFAAGLEGPSSSSPV